MTRHYRHSALGLAAVLALLSATTNLPDLMLVPGVVAVEDLEAEDVPPECAQVCAPIVQLTARCEAQVEAQFGTDKRDLSMRRYRDGLVRDREIREGRERRGDGKKRRRRNLQKMLGRRLSGRQELESEDSSDDEEEPPASLAPGSGLAAVPTLGVGRSASAEDAAKEAAKEAAEAAAKNASRVYQRDHWRMRLRCRTGRSGSGTAGTAGDDFYDYDFLSAGSAAAGVKPSRNNNVTGKLGPRAAFPVIIYLFNLVVNTLTASAGCTTRHPDIYLNNCIPADHSTGISDSFNIAHSAAAIRTPR
ncbi:uncharacterized protein BDZ83DRAFT_756967 [Colletotrichum acutatum]|uniref:Uncharacterized protein n=1 Tax=Glomerella acutata TaxID=27357 RepID=A0AAD8UD00_GLOAC|nr:uncharacterized protein BDZ83DRAFT_756967 [Colletotrichum acutatum]KAK1712903.1 hypothetical protein BDZ83DRAFT_756967 [Colletotrichum acutatum]